MFTALSSTCGRSYDNPIYKLDQDTLEKVIFIQAVLVVAALALLIRGGIWSGSSNVTTAIWGKQLLIAGAATLSLAIPIELGVNIYVRYYK